MKSGKTKIIFVVLCFSAIYLIWGSTYAAIRLAVESFPPYLMGSVRFLLAGGGLYAFLRLRGGPRPAAREWTGPALAGTLMIGGSGGLVYYAVQTVPSSLAATMMATVPLWMVVLDWLGFSGPRPGPWTLGGLILGFVGVFVIAAPAGGGAPVLGVLALLTAPVLWCSGSLLSRQGVQPASSMMASSQQMLSGGAALGVLGLFQGELGRISSHAPSVVSWLAVAYLVVFGSVVAFCAYGWLLRHVRPAAVSTYAFANPLIAIFIGYFLLREPFTGRMTLGAGLIVVAVVVVLLRTAHSSHAQPRPKETVPARARGAELRIPHFVNQRKV